MWPRHEIENYKLALMGLPPVERSPNEPIVFVSAKQLEAEFSFGRRWLGKLVKGRFRDPPVGTAEAETV